MYCKHCGAKIDDDSIFCGECGESVIKEEKVEIAEDVVEASAPIATEETIENEQSEQENIQNGFLALFSNKRNLLIIALSMGVTLLIGAVVLFFVFFNNGGKDKQEHFAAEQSKTVSTTIASATTAKTTVSTIEKTTTTKVSTTVKATTEATTTATERKLKNAIKIDASDSLGIGIVITDDANGLNLRSEPSADSKKVTTMNETSEVIVYDCGESDWYYCKFDDKEGYAKKEFIQVVPFDYYFDDEKCTPAPCYGKLHTIIASDIDSDKVFEVVAYYENKNNNGNLLTLVMDKNGKGIVRYDGYCGGYRPFIAIDHNINEVYLGETSYEGGVGLSNVYPDSLKILSYAAEKKTFEEDKKIFEEYCDNIDKISPFYDIPDKHAAGHWIEGIYSVS